MKDKSFFFPLLLYPLIFFRRFCIFNPPDFNSKVKLFALWLEFLDEMLLDLLNNIFIDLSLVLDCLIFVSNFLNF